MSKHEEFRSQRFFHSLDGLRCISILAVMWHHTPGKWQGIPALARGFLGVDMFFVLSGFLIATLLLRERDKNGDIALNQFYVRRTLRIFPLYYGVLILFAIGLPLFVPQGKMAHEFFSELPFYLTCTSNWIRPEGMLAVAWSLSTEQQFYAIYPPIEKFVKNTSIKFALLGSVIVVSQLINFGLLSQLLAAIGLNYQDPEILQATFTPICFGVLLAHVLHRESGFQAMARWLQPTWTPVVLLALTFLACNLPTAHLAGFPRLLIQMLMTMLLASCVIQEKHGLSGLFNFYPVRRTGVISYGIYLLHLPVFTFSAFILKPMGTVSPGTLFLLCLLLTIIVSEISFRFYEQPFLKLKRLFEPKTPILDPLV
ncbi:acyltransferase [Phormidium sp. CLA17]|uniref:acyltransferase family protein n=1 Tax=Leptolyngbya sp. Cla-17 TaxID=2803751 RepID=UPI001490FDFA|nr:acyltransferase [Leptolyngbya sp. Cla-17]MBM0741873.1 acyltransferase [Leptolyngbya sp. Cla-17]